jgi:hypothetical protein
VPLRELPTVSVAMATFNGERFLAEQLDSLAAQTHLPFELVIVDDGSADATIGVAEGFAENAPFAVRILVNDRSLGHGPAFFRALAECGGDLIAFCDQDDIWRRDKLAMCAEIFARDPGVSLLVHAGRVVDADLRPTRVLIPDVGRSRVVRGDRLSPWFVDRGFAIVIPRWLRDVADVAARPRAFRRVEDRLMDHDEWACFLAPAVGSIAFVAEELAAHRRHGENFSIMEAPGPPVPRPLRRVRSAGANLTVLRPALGGDRGIAGLLDVGTKATAYRTLAQQCQEGASFLSRILEDNPERTDMRAGLHLRAQLYERAASVLEQRADAIHPAHTRAGRLARVVRLALTGRYGRRSRGGIGPVSMPLDVAVAVVGRTTPSASG